MRKWFVIAALFISVSGFITITGKKNDPATVRAAITKSLPLLQKTSYTFLVNAVTCYSCHGEALGLINWSLAKEKGFAIPDSIVRGALDSTRSTITRRMRYLAQNDDPAAIVISGVYDLWAFDATGIAPDKITSLLARNIMQRQRKDGSWVSPNGRPPLEYYSFSATAMAIRGLQKYLPAIYKEEIKSRTERAKEWMMKTPALANEEKVFQLLGFSWANGDKNFIKKQAKQLIASQHEDGGWSQLDSLPSDAYATGQSLYALYKSGELATDDPVYQKGVSFLLRTQFDDGSWKVVTRSFPSVPYTESGFPHGDNQFISTAGSNWATMALLLTLKNANEN